MARFQVNDSVRADCLMRALETITALLHSELDSSDGIDPSTYDPGILMSPFADIALVMGVSEQDWLTTYRENAEYYAERGIILK